MGAGDERIEALRYQGDRGMGIGVQVRKDVRQNLCRRHMLDICAPCYQRQDNAPLGKSVSCTPSEGVSVRLVTLKPRAFLGVGGVIALSYSEMRCPGAGSRPAEP